MKKYCFFIFLFFLKTYSADNFFNSFYKQMGKNFATLVTGTVVILPIYYFFLKPKYILIKKHIKKFKLKIITLNLH